MATKRCNFSARRIGIVMCLAAICLGSAWADEFYGGGVEVDIDREVHGWLWIADATVNLHENAWIKNVYDGGSLVSEGLVFAQRGAVLNIYGGRIDSLMIVTTSSEELPEAEVTVYGSAFAVGGVPVNPDVTELFLQYETLSGVYASGTEFAFDVECYWSGNFYLTVKLGWVQSTSEIAVDAEEVAFGQVQIDDEQIEVVTVSNVGNANLTLQSLGVEQAGALDFGFMPLAQLPVTIEPGQTLEIEVVYSPSVEGAANAVLLIGSDDPAAPVVEVLLSGAGFDPVLTPAEQIAVITRFYGDSLQNGTIAGTGPGNSARAKAVVVGQTLVLARNLIHNERLQRLALIPLLSVQGKTNGSNRPVDFVGGPAVPVLNMMVSDLIDDLRNK